MRRVVREQRQAARGCIQRSARIEISISRFIDFIVDSYELRSGIRITNRYNYIYIYKIRRVQRVITLLRYCQMRLYIVEMSRRSFLIVSDYARLNFWLSRRDGISCFWRKFERSIATTKRLNNSTYRSLELDLELVICRMFKFKITSFFPFFFYKIMVNKCFETRK